ncbi:T9SS type A sorting domain-containing protein [Dyadobacter sp. LHD-138]|uniref:T9SS type A sorting domain-containing protein n=1 Tax=Dyadobacter sp. LHD-138 TaxID=3071413 RepID=UPI0027E14ACF|nr:T9SS type A sorting domain-containing protein [Dyadobacter sp. LHD-138]MDQ6482524.1 T9SS type A sorting domain-containing protein [Dyadobacter sp. LHD-138]
MDNVDVSETTYPNQHDAGRSFKTSWLLTDIISQGGKEHIKLKYKTGIYHTSSSRTDVGSIKSTDIMGLQTIPNSVTYDPTSTGYSHISVSQGITTSTHYVALIESIEFNNGKVLFGYETSGSMPAVYDGYKLKNVEVYNSDNKLIQKHSFTQANYTGDTKRYKLTRLERFGLPAGTANETHSFDYTEPPTPAPNNPVDLKGIDYWGFYNEKNTNGTLVPGFYKIQAFAPGGAFTYYSTGSADRTANPVPTNYYVIRKITFPTGGTTEFEFEGNKANWAFVATNAGGLRVARIINTVEGVQEIKTYEYGGDGCTGCGSIRLNPFQLESFFTMGYTHKEIILTAGCVPENNYLIKVSSDIVDGSSYFETSPVLYSTVTEHIGSGTTANQGKTIYTFDQPSLVFADTPYARYLSTVDYWKGSNLKEKETFAYGAGSYATIRKETFNYNKVLRDTLPSQYIEPFAIDADSGDPSFAYQVCGHGQNAFRIFDYKITTGVVQLSDKTIVSDGVTTTETYQYPANYNVPSLSTFINSEGQSFETTYTYPFDVPAYSAMVTANIVNPVVTQTVKEGTMARLTKTDFGCASGSWGTSSPCIYVPTQVSTQRIAGGISGTLYPEIAFNSYNDRGYPTQYTERNGVSTILDWSSAAGSINQLASMTTGVGSALAQTSSWTYEPLVGSKTTTGPDGKVLYYEYDAFNRLKNIRNDGASGGIRNAYCYNYYGQTLSECSAITVTGTVSPENIALIPEINDGPLPVTLLNFTATREGSSGPASVALLSWSTTAETNSERFDIERGQDGKTWSKLGSVSASGESSSMKHYDFRDRFPIHGQNLYRLKMVDLDGTYAYSRIQSLRFDGSVAVYPNPLVMGDKLHLDTSVSGPVKNVRIYDIQGKLVFSGEPVGNTIQTNSLSVGVYMVHLIEANGMATIHRVIKQ